MHNTFKTVFNNCFIRNFLRTKPKTNMRKLFSKRIIFSCSSTRVFVHNFLDNLNFSKRPITTIAYITPRSQFDLLNWNIPLYLTFPFFPIPVIVTISSTSLWDNFSPNVVITDRNSSIVMYPLFSSSKICKWRISIRHFDIFFIKLLLNTLKMY